MKNSYKAAMRKHTKARIVVRQLAQEEANRIYQHHAENLTKLQNEAAALLRELIDAGHLLQERANIAASSAYKE